ncbi:MAG: hypothetical protein HXY34_00335 [Candidatus Thorarchaeota archaeon]|nr:hypothetical protein [Candidatus Thorarchaeota archaeon]
MQPIRARTEDIWTIKLLESWVVGSFRLRPAFGLAAVVESITPGIVTAGNPLLDIAAVTIPHENH